MAVVPTQACQVDIAQVQGRDIVPVAHEVLEYESKGDHQQTIFQKTLRQQEDNSIMGVNKLRSMVGVESSLTPARTCRSWRAFPPLQAKTLKRWPTELDGRSGLPEDPLDGCLKATQLDNVRVPQPLAFAFN